MSPKPKSRKAARKKSTTRKRARKGGVERERGPRGWLLPVLESAYARLTPRDTGAAGGAADDAAAAPGPSRVAMRSTLRAARRAIDLAPLGNRAWIDRLSEYKQRKAAAALGARPADAMRAGPMPAGPVISGAPNWAPLGPTVVTNGQAHGLPPVAGRISGIAVLPGGQIVFAASANGGVFRSDDGGVSWRALMDAFDVDPTHFASTSLACGAIAVDATDPQRIYVGTGEGDTHAMFENRITDALPAYRGIGPIRSDDGGSTWLEEATAAASPTLAGAAFFGLAVDPRNRDNVIGASTEGLYQRTLTAAGVPEWVKRRTGIYSSIVVAANGTTTRFFAARWGGRVVRSTNGTSWSTAGTGFPTSNVGRVALAVQPTNPNVVYAFVANASNGVLGVYRLNSVSGAWQRVTGVPDVVPGGQADYDLAIAVDPAELNRIYLGGSYFADNQYWPASVWRCAVQPAGSAYSMSGTAIGKHAHADVHVLCHTPDDPNTLWVGCDGGIYVNRDPRGTGNFQARNNGLACLCTNFFAQHPTDPGIMFCGLQDNGTARASAGSIWKHVNWGDGGYCLINWSNPQQVLVFANGSVYRATDGGLDHNSWSATTFPWAMMTEPIVGAPYNPASPNDGRIVALGAGRAIHLSRNFGSTWSKIATLPVTGGIFALSFATPDRLYAGTVDGDVFRYDLAGTTWTATRLDNVAAAPLGLRGLVSDIAIDWSDVTRSSVYLAFGGSGDYRHVWHFDGTRWRARSGPAAGPNLLDVEHNALAVDPVAPNNVYVGADIGVWHSSDGGQNWNPLPNGLPDAPVFDLQIHPTRRLLRAATHGRGMYEWAL